MFEIHCFWAPLLLFNMPRAGCAHPKFHLVKSNKNPVIQIYPLWDKSPSELQLLWETELRENSMTMETSKEEKGQSRLSLDSWGRATHAPRTEWQVSWQQNNHTDSWFAVPYGAILGTGHARLSPKATQRSREKGKPAAFAKRKGNWNEVIQLWSGEETKIPTTK